MQSHKYFWARDENYYKRKTKYVKLFFYTLGRAEDELAKANEDPSDLEILKYFVAKCEQFPNCEIGTDDGYYGLFAEGWEEVPMTEQELAELAKEYEEWKLYKKTEPKTIKFRRWGPLKTEGENE